MKVSFSEKQPNPDPPGCLLLSPAVCACFHRKIVSLSFPFFHIGQYGSDHSNSSFMLTAVTMLCPLTNLWPANCPSFLLVILIWVNSISSQLTSQNVLQEGRSTLYFTNYSHFPAAAEVTAQHLTSSLSPQNHLQMNIWVLYLQQIFTFNGNHALNSLLGSV